MGFRGPDRPSINLLRPFDADKMTAWKADALRSEIKIEGTPAAIIAIYKSVYFTSARKE